MTRTKAQKARAIVAVAKKKSRKQRVAKGPISVLSGNTVKIGKRKSRGTTFATVPAAKTYRGMPTPAQIRTMENETGNCTRVTHTEFISDVVGNPGQAAEGLPINPGNKQLFPWLSAQAVRYESYIFRKLEFTYHTSSPTTNNGTVVITVDYNPAAPLPAGKVQALAMQSAVRNVPWDEVMHRSTRQNLSKRKSYFVMNEDFETSRAPDLTTYHTGVAMFMVNGVSAFSDAIGEIHVHYVVDLMTPTLTNSSSSGYNGTIEADNVPSNNGTWQFLWDNDVVVAPEGAPFRTGPGINVLSTDFDGGTPGFPMGAVEFTQPGIYMCQFRIHAPTQIFPSGTGGSWGVGGSEGVTYTNVNPGPGNFMLIGPAGELGTVSWVVTVPQTPARFGFGSIDGLTNPATSIDSLIMITPMSSQDASLPIGVMAQAQLAMMKKRGHSFVGGGVLSSTRQLATLAQISHHHSTGKSCPNTGGPIFRTQTMNPWQLAFMKAQVRNEENPYKAHCKRLGIEMEKTDKESDEEPSLRKKQIAQVQGSPKTLSQQTTPGVHTVLDVDGIATRVSNIEEMLARLQVSLDGVLAIGYRHNYPECAAQ